MLYWRVRPSPPSRRITKSDRKGDRAKVHECSAAVSTSLTAQTVGNEHDTCPHGGPCLKSNDARRRRTLPRTRGTGTTGSHTRTHLAPQAAAAMYYSLCVYISTTGLIPLRAGPMNFSLKCVARKWLEIFHLSENVWGNPPLAEAALDPLCRRWILGRNRNAAVHSDYNDESNLLF